VYTVLIIVFVVILLLVLSYYAGEVSCVCCCYPSPHIHTNSSESGCFSCPVLHPTSNRSTTANTEYGGGCTVNGDEKSGNH
jgi:hypothetical protein